MPARAPFKNLCPRERTRLADAERERESLLPLRGGSCSNAMFPPGTAVGPKPPRAAPAFLRRASPRQSRSFPERPSFLRFRPRPFFSPWSDRPHSFVPRRRAQALLRRELFPAAPLSPLQSRLFALPFPSRADGRAPRLCPAFGTVPFQPCTPVSHSCSTREKIRFPGEITNFFSGIRPPPLDLAPPPCYLFFELKNSEGCFPKAHRDPA